MNKIRVLYIIEELELGGAERVVIDQALSLDRAQFQVFVCCLRAKGEFAVDLERENIPVFELHKKKGIDFSIIGRVQKVIKDNDIDIVHTHLWVANFWGRIASILVGVPVVVTEHNVDVWKKFHHKVIDRCLARFTSVICVVSQQVKVFYQTQVGINEKKLRVVYNGMRNLDKCTNDAKNTKLKEELNVNNGAPVIVNIGRLAEAKANHVFFEALRILDKQGVEFNALTIGDGPLKEQRLKEGSDLIASKKLQLTGLRKDIHCILDIADVSVLSSTREGFSIVVLESMAKGVPFVATRVGGNPEQIAEGQTGFLVDSGDSNGLAHAMKKILTDKALAKNMSEASKKRIKEEFSLKIMMDKTKNIYREVLGKA
ncbi:MAG: glycosyltransferase involved in cell wall biosynthesis [Candidatus Omnitrophota bacterium]|jgi:glycosyltransferase involved in cell wall biosynthesis